MTLYGLIFVVFLGIVFLSRWVNILNEYERDHKHDHQQPADDHGYQTLADGIGSQRRTHGSFFKDIDRGRQGTGSQHNSQIACFLGGKSPGNPCLTACNFFLDNRGGIHAVIQRSSSIPGAW